MKREVSYFYYNFLNWRLVGEVESQILDTLRYYKFERSENSEEEKKMYGQIIIPSLDEIKSINDINIQVVLPLAHVNHFIEARVKPNFVFNVNANAVTYLRSVAASYETMKRWDLYKFIPGIEGFYWFLPGEIMESLKNYNWELHQKQIREWLNGREKILKGLEDEGKLIRPFKNM